MPIKNINKLIVKLDSAVDITQPLIESCLLVENTAKLNCPVDTGQLRSSITHHIEGEQGEVGTNVDYAPYVEYGTGIFARDGDGRLTPWRYQDSQGNWHTTQGQNPQPFLEPALDQNREQIQQIFDNYIKEVLKK